MQELAYPDGDTRSANDGTAEPRHSFERTAGEGELSLDTVFSLLSNERRRLVLRHLARAEGEVAFRDLVQQVAAWENGVDTTEVTYEQRKRVYTSLHQVHLPKLEDAEVVESDDGMDTIRLTPRADELAFTLTSDVGGGRSNGSNAVAELKRRLSGSLFSTHARST